MSLRKWAARGTEKVEVSFGRASCRRDGCGRYVRSSLPLAPSRAAAPANRTRHPAETQPTRSPSARRSPLEDLGWDDGLWRSGLDGTGSSVVIEPGRRWTL
jgi:hypothetical protein